MPGCSFRFYGWLWARHERLPESEIDAVKLGGTGDLTGTDAVVWETTRGISYVYLATEDGDGFVVKAGRQFETVATNTMTAQSFIASPIAVANELYLRSRTHLLRISGKIAQRSAVRSVSEASAASCRTTPLSRPAADRWKSRGVPAPGRRIPRP